MAADVSKQLERAKKFLEKNRVEDAIEAYLAVLDGAPQNLEASQALGDLYARLEQPDRAAVYYGHLFDLLIDPKVEPLIGARVGLRSAFVCDVNPEGFDCTQIFAGALEINAPEALGQLEAGTLRALAVTTSKRSPFLLNVPAMSETVPGYDTEVWWDLLGPAGMPADLVSNGSLSAALRTAANRRARAVRVVAAARLRWRHYR